MIYCSRKGPGALALDDHIKASASDAGLLESIVEEEREIGSASQAAGDPLTEALSEGREAKRDREMPSDPEVAAILRDQYSINLQDLMRAVDPNDHHSWFSRLAAAASTDEISIISECARAYVQSLAENDRDILVEQLKAAIRR